MSKKALQIVNALVGIATLLLGSMQIALGVRSPLYAAANLPAFPILDSNLRFFGGLGVGLAVLLLWILPSIERQTDLYRAFWICAFLGGVGRLVSALVVGWPSNLLLGFTMLEVVGAPFFVYWQYRVATDLVGGVAA